jgi:hypothetical protein
MFGAQSHDGKRPRLQAHHTSYVPNLFSALQQSGVECRGWKQMGLVPQTFVTWLEHRTWPRLLVSFDSLPRGQTKLNPAALSSAIAKIPRSCFMSFLCLVQREEGCVAVEVLARLMYQGWSVANRGMLGTASRDGLMTQCPLLSDFGSCGWCHLVQVSHSQLWASHDTPPYVASVNSASEAGGWGKREQRKSFVLSCVIYKHHSSHLSLLHPYNFISL